MGILLAYSLLVPLFRAPDELQHVGLVIASRTSPGYGDYDSTFTDARVEAGARLLGRPALHSTGQTPEAIPRGERPTLDELGSPAPGGRNQQTQHPPLYYASMGAASTFITTMIPGESTWSFDRLVYLLRVLNVALVASIPAIAYLTARRIGVSIRASVFACLLVMAIPQLAHIGSSVNNDNLVVLLGALAALGAAAVTVGDLTRRRVVWLGVVLGLALLTKATSLTFVPMVGLAYAIHLRRDARLVVRRVLETGAVAFVAGGWWLAKNLIQHGTVQPSDAFYLVPQDVEPVVGDWAERFFYLLPVRFWGHFGYLEVKLNRPLIVFGTALVLGGITWALAQRRRRVPVAVLLVPFAGSLVLLARKTWNRYLLVGRPIPGIQGRYLFVSIVGMVVAVASAVDALPRWIHRGVVGFGAALVVVMHAMAVRVIVRRFWGTEVEAWNDRLDDLRAWSPLPALLTDLVLAGSVLVMVALAVVCVLDAVVPEPDAAAEGTA